MWTLQLLAVIQDGSVRLKVDTQHLRDVSFLRTNSMYQFIGELLLRLDNDVQLSFLLKLWSAWFLFKVEITVLHVLFSVGNSTCAHRKECRQARHQPVPAVLTHPTATWSEIAYLKESMTCSHGTGHVISRVQILCLIAIELLLHIETELDQLEAGFNDGNLA
jgi:hypothetical protein